MLFAPPASAQDHDEGAGDESTAVDELLRDGSEVYDQVCAACHQAGGVGLAGTFPPLVDNDHVDDTTYVTMVIEDGLQGEIVVAGTTYNGVMPPFAAALTDDDAEALIAFIQNDFVAPAPVAVAPTGPTSGSDLPGFVNIGKWLAYALGIGAAAVVFAPRILGQIDRLDVPWLDAWLKTALIVIAVVLLTVFIPDRVIKADIVAKRSSFVKDLIGVSVWMAGMGVVVGGLWYAHRESRV